MLSWELIQDIVWDALLDTLKLLPFLFFAYLLMEAAEHRFSEKMEARLKSMGGLGPLVGAILGCVPQCGFSSAASNLYAAGLVSRGTLLAVFLSTSDEALPLMIGSPQGRRMIPLLLLSKVAIGIAAGFAVDLVLKKTGSKRELYDLCENCGCEEEGGILRPALWHTGHILLFILGINLLLNGAIELLGQERIASFLFHRQHHLLHDDAGHAGGSDPQLRRLGDADPALFGGKHELRRLPGGTLLQRGHRTCRFAADEQKQTGESSDHRDPLSGFGPVRPGIAAFAVRRILWKTPLS